MGSAPQRVAAATGRHLVKGVARQTIAGGLFLMLLLIIAQFTTAGAGVFRRWLETQRGLAPWLSAWGPGDPGVTVFIVIAAFVGRLPWRMTGLPRRSCHCFSCRRSSSPVLLSERLCGVDRGLRQTRCRLSTSERIFIFCSRSPDRMDTSRPRVHA